MLSISDENIIEEIEREGSIDDDGGVRILHNQTDPTIISDGVDVVNVVKEDEDRYRIDYWGYLTGCLLITKEGAKELGEELLAGQEEIPYWTVESVPDETSDWIPDEYSPPSRVNCDNCQEPTPVTEILTPGKTGGKEYGRYCRDCWAEEDRALYEH